MAMLSQSAQRQMKNIIIVLNMILMFTACTDNKVNTGDVLNDKCATLERENDSLKRLLAIQQDTVNRIEEQTEKIVRSAKNSTGKGRHPITLQWISWDKPGYVDVSPLEDGWYTISGRQTSNDAIDYLKIDGKIRRISEKELEFNGRIETLTSSNNNGEVCVKEGKQVFFAKGNRKYFRMQNMTNCEGGMLVDYVDIYPGSSSLLD